MSGFGQALGAGLLGAVAGGAQSFSNQMGKQISDEAELTKARSLEELRAEMQTKREEMLRQQKIAENQRVQATAKGLAGKEMGGKMDEAKAIYEQSGMSPEDIALGVGATDAARQNVEPGREHIKAAMMQEGLLTQGQNLQDMDAQEGKDYSRGRDAAKDKQAEEDKVYSHGRDAVKDKHDQAELALRSKQVNAAIAQSAASAADAATGRADKKALKEAYQLYATALITEHNKPGTMTGTLTNLTAKIASLGGSTSTIRDELMGKPIFGEQSTKTGDASMGQPEVETKKKVELGRTGGVLKQPEAKKPPPTAADIAATAKKYGMTEQQVKAKLGIK